MKKSFIFSYLLLVLILSSACSSSKSSSLGNMDNMLAIMQVDEPIPGVCDNSMVVAILPFPGGSQVKAKTAVTDEEIETLLNTNVAFLKDKSDYNDKGMVGLIVNCEGKMVRCEIDNKTKNHELDQQIVDVFSELKEWKPGTVKGKPVDTSVLYSFTIKKGQISL